MIVSRRRRRKARGLQAQVANMQTDFFSSLVGAIIPLLIQLLLSFLFGGPI